MARKERVRAAMFHGEVTELGADTVSFEGRALGKPDKGAAQITPKPTSTVPFTVTETTRIEVDDAEGSFTSLQPGMFGVVKASGTLGSYTALLISVSTEEEEIDTSGEDGGAGGVTDGIL